MLSLQVLLNDLNITRDSYQFDKRLKEKSFENDLTSHPKLKSVFTKRVKPKKRHEVERMSEICAETAKDCKVTHIVDFGAGLGHLSRKLAYGHGLRVCCLEQQANLADQAGYGK